MGADCCLAQVLNVANLKAFEGFADHFAGHTAHYQALFESQDAHAHALAAPFDARLSVFQKLCVLRCIRPDKVMLGVQVYIPYPIPNPNPNPNPNHNPNPNPNLSPNPATAALLVDP